jgi:peptidoglycan/xylan/chitin deacetylase (PgdA/CDA1 family)
MPSELSLTPPPPVPAPARPPVAAVGVGAAWWVFSLAGKAAGLALFSRFPWTAALCFCGPDLYLLYGLLHPASQAVGRVFTRFLPEGPEVWLTIDDGPDPGDTPRLLDLLEQHRARATFFLIGVRAERHPELVAEILRRGHEVGHHTHRHPVADFWCASPRRVAEELDRGLEALRRAGARPARFRSPVGIKNLFLAKALAARGLACVAWSVRPRDTVGRDPRRIAVRALRRVRSGDILVTHEGPAVAPTVRTEAIRLILEGLRARGLACVLPRPEQLR